MVGLVFQSLLSLLLSRKRLFTAIRALPVYNTIIFLKYIYTMYIILCKLYIIHVYTSFCVNYYVKPADLTWLSYSPYLETRNRERTETSFSENGQSLQFFSPLINLLELA